MAAIIYFFVSYVWTAKWKGGIYKIYLLKFFVLFATHITPLYIKVESVEDKRHDGMEWKKKHRFISKNSLPKTNI